MSFKNRREVLFVYSVKDANPNGDPLNANHPRMDEQSGQILVSDVRIKRTIRDQWLREGLEVFVDSEPKTLKTRMVELRDKYKVKTSAKTAESKEVLGKCIDARVFGVTLAEEGSSFSWTGPLQFKWGRSLHQAEVELVQGTGAFATKDEAEQRTFRNEYIVPFTVIGVYGIANQYSSIETGATNEDIASVVAALWQGTINLITRSKVGHQPRLLLEIIYKEGFEGMIGSLDEKVVLLRDGQGLSVDEELALRSLKGVQISLDEISERAATLKENIQEVRLIAEKGLQIGGKESLVKVFGSRFHVEER